MSTLPTIFQHLTMKPDIKLMVGIFYCASGKRDYYQCASSQL